MSTTDPKDHDHVSSFPDPAPESSRDLAASLVTRCHTLIAELDAFQSLLAETQRNPQIVEIRSLRSNAVSELRTLEKLADKIDASAAAKAEADDDDLPDDTQQRLMHALRSSNLPFYEAVWTIAKRTCTGLVAFGKRFYWDGVDGGWEEGGKKRPNKDKRRSVFVDIVADDGEEWVKVSTISETRLLFEMAKKGWEGESEAGSEEERVVLRNYDDDRSMDSDEDDDDEVELVKLAIDMRKSADKTRVRYRHPRLRFVIPKVEEGENPDIDDLLKVIRGYGITLECGGAAASSKPAGHTLEEDLRRLLPKPFKRFTPTLNVDCTLLLAMVSDVSHIKNITPTPGLHKAIVRQMEVEQERPLLTKELWPAMVGHELVCTGEAARRMREIVDTIGTESEKARTKILMGDPPFDELERESVIQKFQELSDYQIPSQWRIPVKVVESQAIIDSAKTRGVFPPVSERITDILSDINYSVFMYGWATNMMTISSNRTVVKQIENMVEKHRDGDENLEGPLIWVCDTARSLIGKEKGRKN